MKSLLLFFALLLAQLSYGQAQRSAHWFFGYEAGLDFSTGTVSADVNGKLASIEGSSTMSDLSGNLLFYSNGEKVWNRNHALMPNGNNLTGDQSSTQSSLIVPKPGDDNLYYLFTSVGLGPVPSGLYYNVVDMSSNGGLGDVTAVKNSQLLSAGTEQLAGTKHCNGTDYWIVSRESVSGILRFYAYQLTKDGLSDPVISEFSEINNGKSNTVGTISFSQDGSLMAFTSFQTAVYLFDFNTKSGKLSTQLVIYNPVNEQSYGNAISPDNSKLYITSVISNGYNYLAQFDLKDPLVSRKNLDSMDFRMGSPNGFPFIGQIRLASDQQIYVSRWKQAYPLQVNPDTYYDLDSIDVIHKPDLPGLSCQFQRDFLYLHGKPTEIGLPGFISNFTSDAPPLSCPIVIPVVDFTVLAECEDQPVQFTYTGSADINSVEWDFGDPAGGPANTSTLTNPSHSYAQPGDYTVSLTVNYTDGTITDKKMVRAGAARVDLGNDTTLCLNDVLILNVPANSDEIKWQDNSTGPTFPVNAAGKYYVSLMQHDCPASDSIQVKYIQAPVFSFGPDLALCTGETILVDPMIKDSNSLVYQWQDGSTQKIYAVSAPGLYTLTATNICGSATSSLNVVSGYCEIYLPSAFTPNGDGHNDLFKPIRAADIKKYQLTIYNRWGQIVFESNDVNNGWDGFYQGHRQPGGVYVWSVKYSSPLVTDKIIHGTLTLVL